MLISNLDSLLLHNMSINENRRLKMNFHSYQEFFLINFDYKMVVKKHLRIKTKNHAADSETGCLTKSIFKPYCRETAMPTA